MMMQCCKPGCIDESIKHSMYCHKHQEECLKQNNVNFDSNNYALDVISISLVCSIIANIVLGILLILK